MKGIYKSIIDSPRWINVKKILREGAYIYDLDLEVEEEKQFLYKATYFKVSGDPDQITKFVKAIKYTLDYYNKESE